MVSQGAGVVIRSLSMYLVTSNYNLMGFDTIEINLVVSSRLNLHQTVQKIPQSGNMQHPICGTELVEIETKRV